MKRSILILYLIVVFSNYLFADRFVRDNTKNTVIDAATNLMWQDDGDAKNRKKKWAVAINYCDGLDFGGYSDWKLPNVNELTSITNYASTSNNYFYPIFRNVSFTVNDSEYYWTSTSYSTSKAWIVGGNGGSTNDGFDASLKNKSNHIRCVRVID